MGNNCQVPTPQKYANELLDCIDILMVCMISQYWKILVEKAIY